MDMTAVVSSQISAVGYDADSRKMEIRFANGALYQYDEVPKATYDGLMSADSIGRYHKDNVKYAFPYRRLE